MQASRYRDWSTSKLQAYRENGFPSSKHVIKPPIRCPQQEHELRDLASNAHKIGMTEDVKMRFDRSHLLEPCKGFPTFCMHLLCEVLDTRWEFRDAWHQSFL